MAQVFLIYISMTCKAFTLVELVVVITILRFFQRLLLWVILRICTMHVIAQDLQMRELWNPIFVPINKKGAYPLPSSFFAITYSGSTVAKQGILDDNVGITDMAHVPQDPRLSRYYGYSVTGNQQSYQIALTLEKQNKSQAYVDGDYKTVAKNILPSLFLAMTGLCKCRNRKWICWWSSRTERNSF